MGRAIDMEKDIDVLKKEVERLDNIVRGMSSKLDSLLEKGTQTKHVDLVDDVKKEEKKDGKKTKKANNKGSTKSDVSDDTAVRDDKSKNK